MKSIYKTKNKHIWLENFLETKEIIFPFNGEPFVCMIWNNKEDFVSPPLIQKVLQENCKYFLAGGKNSENWHHYADEIHISLYPDFSPPDWEHVMTTWHENETLEEVMWFALNNTNFDHHDFKNYVLIEIDTHFSQMEILKLIHTIDS